MMRKHFSVVLFILLALPVLVYAGGGQEESGEMGPVDTLE